MKNKISRSKIQKKSMLRGFENVLRLIILIWFSVVLFAPANAQLEDLGVYPLNTELVSRPLGMGGAFVGLADDVNAAFYNPAGLAWVKGVSLTMKDSENIVAQQAYPFGHNASFGLAVITRRISDIPIPTGVADSSSSIVFLSYGTKLTFIPQLAKNPLFQRLGFGINIKGLVGQTLRRTALLDRSATGWDIDLGVLWKGEEWWSVGLSMQNILPADTLGGGLIRWDIGGEESIPAGAKIAGSARVIGDIGSPFFMEGRELLLAGDLSVSRSRPVLFRFGGEWGFDKTYFIRAGYMQQYKAQGVSSDINFGLGYRTERWGIDFSSYHQPSNNQRCASLSILYFPEEWIVVRELDIERPKVMIEKPIEMISLEDNIVTYDEKIEVFGKVKPGVEVYINGLPVSLDPEYSFKTVVPLRLGKNLIIVEARYGGEKKVWKYKVLRKAKVKIADEEKVKDLEEKKEKVESLITIGVIEITPEAEFIMEAGVTRGELCSWLVKAADIKLPEVKTDLFADVPKDHPLAPYIKAVVDLKLLKPFPDGTFRPGAVVTKEEGDAIFERYKMTR